MIQKYSPLTHRGVFFVGGVDRQKFLQGLITQDIRKIEGGAAIYGAFLTPQGKFLHDLFIGEEGDRYLIETDKERLPALLQKLGLYKLRANVEIGAVPELEVYASPHGSKNKPGTVINHQPLEFVDPRAAAAGTRLWSAAPPVGLLPFEAYDRHRIALVLPDGPRDIIPERGILLENRFEELNGVDWDKGCYLGQELTARTHYRGLVRKKLFAVEIDGEAPAFDAPLFLGEKEAGHMRSVQGDLGLALLRLELVEGKEAVLTAGKTWLKVKNPVP